MEWWDKYQKSIEQYIKSNSPSSNVCADFWGIAFAAANYHQTPNSANSAVVLKGLQQLCKDTGVQGCTPDATGFDDFLKKNDKAIALWASNLFSVCGSSNAPSPSPPQPSPPQPSPPQPTPKPKPSVPTEYGGLPMWVIVAIVAMFLFGTLLVLALD